MRCADLAVFFLTDRPRGRCTSNKKQGTSTAQTTPQNRPKMHMHHGMVVHAVSSPSSTTLTAPSPQGSSSPMHLIPFAAAAATADPATLSIEPAMGFTCRDRWRRRAYGRLAVVKRPSACPPTTIASPPLSSRWRRCVLHRLHSVNAVGRFWLVYCWVRW